MTHPGPNLATQTIILAVETDIPKQFLNNGRIVSIRCAFQDLTPDYVSLLTPKAVFCPLFKGRFDAIDMCQTLAKSQWRAPLYVIAPPLPCPQMVLTEIRAACPDVTIHLYDATEQDHVLPRIA